MSREASRVCNGFGVLDMSPGLETQRISPPQSLHLFFLWAGVGASSGLASPPIWDTGRIVPADPVVYFRDCQELPRPQDTLGLPFFAFSGAVPSFFQLAFWQNKTSLVEISWILSLVGYFQSPFTVTKECYLSKMLSYSEWNVTQRPAFTSLIWICTKTCIGTFACTWIWICTCIFTCSCTFTCTR